MSGLASPPICIVGQALVDVTGPQNGHPYKMRLGGILHAARALWAANQPYVIAYAAPDYLAEQVEHYALRHGASVACQISSVIGSPNVVLIGEVKEAADQGYEYLLRDEHRARLDLAALEHCLAQSRPSDVLIISGGFDLSAVIAAAHNAGARVHVDLTGAADDWAVLAALAEPVETLTLSTSSKLFAERFAAEPKVYWEEVLPRVSRGALLKENRGGSRFRRANTLTTISTPAFLGNTEHSVGVGDCFDAIWIALRRYRCDEEALLYASLVAADYAATTYPDLFGTSVAATLRLPADQVREAVGCLLPWEDRAKIHVYVAGPDFDFADRRPIDAVAGALRYHNFVPRLPVRENGQMGLNASSARKATLLAADLALIERCHLMVAVLTYDDPGTLIEVGLACERGIPTAVFDPSGRAENLFLTSLPKLVTSDLEKVVSFVFEEASRLRKGQ